MENKFYKVFCGALGFGIVAMIMLAIVLCCGKDNWWLATFACCALFSIVFVLIVFCRYCKNVDREYEDAINKKKEKIKELEAKISNLPNPEKEAVKCDMLKHQERMALIKQLENGAPNQEIIALLKEKY